MDTKKKKELEDKIKEMENGWQRCQADFDNYRRRTEEQKSAIADFIKTELLTKLAPVLDNFRRAFEHLDITDPKIMGLKMTEKQLEDILKSEGLERIETQGQFDPILHEAISHEESAVPADDIIEEIESGRKFGDKVIKPAKVRVSKGK
jgi:molecular chaperone GrpE